MIPFRAASFFARRSYSSLRQQSQEAEICAPTLQPISDLESAIVGSGGSALVIVRAIGPSLSSSGITGALQDPTIELHDGNGGVIGFDDNWQDAQSPAVKATGLQPSDNRESALVASLAPGGYTAVVRGKNNTTGVALVEAYRIP